MQIARVVPMLYRCRADAYTRRETAGETPKRRCRKDHARLHRADIGPISELCNFDASSLCCPDVGTTFTVTVVPKKCRLANGPFANQKPIINQSKFDIGTTEASVSVRRRYDVDVPTGEAYKADVTWAARHLDIEKWLA